MKNKLLYIICILLVFSCKPEKPTWESSYIVPILSTSLNINKLVNDTVLKVENDESVTLVYKQNLNTTYLNDFVQIPNTGFERNYKLSNVNLNDQQFNQQITLGMLAQSWPGWGVLILANNGSNLTLPDITNVTAGPFQASIQNVFQSATLNNGFLDIEVTNNLPVDLTNVEFEISNAGSGTVLVTHTFPILDSGVTQSASFNMAGKTIEGNLEIRLLNMDVEGNGDTYTINTSDAIDLKMTLRNLQIQTATAIFPQQDIINENVVARLALGEPKLKQATISTGQLEIEIVSTVEEEIIFDYKFPKATKQGIPFEITETVLPATTQSSSSTTFTYDFSGYNLDLTGDMGTGSNLLTGQLLGRIDSTGNLVTLDLDDSIYINITIKDLEPDYVKGYLGSYRETVGPTVENFSLFNSFADGELLLENATTTFSIENSVGILGAMYVQQLQGENTKTGSKVDLQSSVVGAQIVVTKPTDNPLVPSYKRVILDPSNSNITDLINVTPDKLTYEFDLNLNPNIDSTNTDFQDFAYSTSYIKSDLGIELPLSLIANDLILKDTIFFDENQTLQIEGAKSGILNLIADNGFPIRTGLTLSLLGNDNSSLGFNNTILKEYTSSNDITSSTVIDGRSIDKIRSIVSFPMTEDDITSLINAQGVIITATFNTDQSNYLKIYNDYELLIKLTGEFNYQN